jgi:hypothetical protein
MKLSSRAVGKCVYGRHSLLVEVVFVQATDEGGPFVKAIGSV